ncbi:hypothetical protein WJX72_011532 [[Myrmecia] bisecta]|uniref:Cation efflux protein cytoplasmic domain-containing protein n=1 Tax=[Myrmecia] bisecta TaxID=41462 RepID=A0AAW1PBD8_9CHLO
MSERQLSIGLPVDRQQYQRRGRLSFSGSVVTISHAGSQETPIEEPLLAAHHEDASSPGRDDDASEAVVQPGPSPYSSFERKVSIAMYSSLLVNVLLLITKAFAYWTSQSKSLLASTADSFVDLASQLVLAVANYKIKKVDPQFPIGRTRLEAVAVVSCAIIMSLSTIQVIQSAAWDLYAGLREGKLPDLDMGLLEYTILGVATALKAGLFVICIALRKTSDSMLALAEDHRNDIMSNLSAIAFGGAASMSRKLWWIDPAGAILISLWIIYSWMDIVHEQVMKIVGKGAPTEFIAALKEVADSHHESVYVDVIRAYHFGARFIVEVEVIMPEDMTVRESHDIGLVLQHKLEAYDQVERAFVHVDYARRSEPEHKVERNLLLDSENLFQAHASVSGSGTLLPSGGSGGVKQTPPRQPESPKRALLGQSPQSSAAATGPDAV